MMQNLPRQEWKEMEFELPFMSLQGARRDNPKTQRQGVGIPFATWQLGRHVTDRTEGYGKPGLAYLHVAMVHL